jgi:hypothetical protein
LTGFADFGSKCCIPEGNSKNTISESYPRSPDKGSDEH